MRRSWTTVTSADAGSHDAMRVANALGSSYDSETLASVADALSFLNRFGGELYCVAVREKRTVDGQIIPGEDWDQVPGFFATPMLAWHVDHVGRPKDQEHAEPEPRRGRLMENAREELDAMRDLTAEAEIIELPQNGAEVEMEGATNGEPVG